MHIHRILTNLGFKSCPHEPCLYTGIFQGTSIIFLHQVDDFAIACDGEMTANTFLDTLDTRLKQKLKCQGLVHTFNSIDVEQIQLYTKTSC